MGILRKLATFAKTEDGSATVEATLWVPAMIGLICLAADASFIFFGQNQAYRVVQDANRSLSIGRLSSSDEVETYITTQLASLSPNAVVQSSVTQGMVNSYVRIPSSDLAATGLINSLLTTTITVGSRHFVEY
ncbi:TadE/TadG family type IV pilus assembly protein [Vannielia litorea]|uniref:TadE/TadG family type IV pilus assembly protein n=1 Tax=Vannielia litorea TaxID=1217970 RepID=UPI001BCFA970|nr:TadE family protein [Vannielia litorea]MBS8226661.1 pilus assembly protein [Vannielia litorea]